MSYRIRFYRERCNMNHSYYTGTDDVYMIVRVDDEENLINVLNSLLEHYEGETYSVWQGQDLLTGGAFDRNDVYELSVSLVVEAKHDYEVFDGKEFPTTTAIDPETSDIITVAGELLQDALFKDGEYVSEEAKEIDEAIFFYVPDHLIFGSPTELQEFVNHNLT